MRSLFLLTSSNEVDKYAETLAGLNLGEVKSLRYDKIDHSPSGLLANVRAFAPDLIVYIGSRWGQQPTIAALANLTNRVAPTVHICSDAADPPWHDLLRAYHDAGAFTLQVAIDGSRKWPLADSQMTALTPVDPKHFPPVLAHSERSVACGFAGNAGGGGDSRRTALLSQLLERRLIGLRIRSSLPFTYESYCEYLNTCRMSLNIAWTGTEATTHVKGRVLESALAGAMVLETKGSPTSEWFTPGVDYLEYETVDDVAAALDSIRPIDAQIIALSLRAKVIAEHSPAMFWSRIFERLGMQTVKAAA